MSRISSGWTEFLKQNISRAIAQIRSNNKGPDLEIIHRYLVMIKKLKELTVQHFQQLILQLNVKLNLLIKYLKEQIHFYNRN